MKPLKILFLLLLIAIIGLFSLYKPQTILGYFQFKHLLNQAQAMENPVPSIPYLPTDNFKHTLDLYWPEDKGSEVGAQGSGNQSPEPQTPSPKSGKVLIFFHGGAWQEGDKSLYPFIGKTFSDLGYFTVLPNYRLHPEVDYPKFLEDAASGVKWIVDNIETYGGNPQQIYLMGHSAGGHIATMLGNDPQYLGEDFNNIKGVISIAGVHDLFRYQTKRWDHVFGTFARNNDAMPLNHIKANNPPTLALHGKKDQIVGFEQSEVLVNSIQSKGGKAELKGYQDLNHFSIINALHPKHRNGETVVEDILEWVKQH